MLFSSAITLVTTSVQLYLDYRRNLENIHEELESIRTVYLPSMVNAVWIGDHDQIATLLNGLEKMPDVEFVSVASEGEILYWVGRQQAKRARIETFRLLRPHRGQDMEIGVLTVAVDVDAVLARLFDTALVILAGNAVKTFLVAGFLLLIFHAVVTAPLARIAGFARAFAPGEREGALDLGRAKRRKSDELDDVVGALNDLGESVRHGERQLLDFAEASSDWFWETSPDHRFTYLSERFQEISGQRASNYIGLRRETLPGLEVDPGALAEHLELLEAHKPFRDFTYSLRQDGSAHHIRVSGKPWFDESGTFMGYRGVGSDVTAEVEAREQQERAELRLAWAIEAVPAACALFDGKDRLVICNRIYRERNETTLLPLAPGTSYEAMLRAFVAERGVLGDSEANERWVRERLARRDRPANFYRYRKADGVWVEVSDYVLDDGWLLSFGRDVTKRIETEQALMREKARAEEYLRVAETVIVALDPEGRVLLLNRKGCDLLGIGPDEAIGRDWFDLVASEEERQEHRARFAEITSGRRVPRRYFENEILAKAGERRHFGWHLALTHDAAGEIESVLVSGLDVTEARQAMGALRESEARFRGIFEQAAVGIAYADPKGRLLQVNGKLCDMLGYDRAELEAMTVAKLVHPDDAVADRAEITRLLSGAATTYASERRYRHKDGSTVWGNLTATLARGPDGNARNLVYVVEDISARKRAQAEAQLARDRLASAIADITEGFALYDAERRLVICNAAYRALSGMPDFVGPGISYEAYLQEGLARGLRPEAVGREEAWLAERLSYQRDTGPPFEIERDGRLLEVRCRRTEGGGRIHLVVDVTERHAAEERLRQASKMEAIGKLSGGVAHDFNNLLAVILGNLELIEMHSEPDSKIHRLIMPAISAVARGATLTERMLAFSRQQTLQPKVIDLNEIVIGLNELMERSLSENVEIELGLAEGLWHCEADPVQLESVVLNLAINGRDALPEGGRLLIATDNVTRGQRSNDGEPDLKPGDYVRLAVTDDGCGMPPEVLEKAFEPFYTTKDVGEGTGLGLSMVYGFITQSGGHVSIDSEPGRGTTVEVLLPRVERPLAREAPAKTESALPLGQGETILMVEDDPAVLDLTAALLGDLGYRTLPAPDAEAALCILNGKQGDGPGNGAIDLLVTDVVLSGGMNGKELAERVRRVWPNLGVLYVSGYSEQAIADGGRLETDAHLLRKPFLKAELARKIREVLADRLIE